jgi:hypothetical protein
MNTEVSRCANILRKQNVFDLVYTIDSNDASSSDCFLWNTFYSFNKKYSDIPIKNDMYFCGAPKGRDDILISCMREAKEKNVDLSMDLICFDEFELYDRGFSEITIHTSEDFLPYEEVLQNELHARCILEVVQKGQTALTLRPYEAVVYNRKVFSNNKNILKCRFYDERFMRYFESPEDIDWEWVKDDTKIDYGYFAGGVFLSDTSFGRYQEKAENGTFVTVKSIRQGKNICEK